MSESNSGCSAGFSIIELVVAIVIVGIISALGMSRLLSGSSFNAIAVRDQIISMTRTSQQSALGRTDVELVIQPDGSGSTLTITSSDNNGVIEQTSVSMGGVTLSGDINETDSCASSNGTYAIASATPMTLNFGELGDLTVSGVTGNTGAVTSAVRICINNNTNSSVCVAPSGFAYAGDCDV